MKKITLFAIVALLSVTAFSQKGVFDNAVYIRPGYAFPGGDMKDGKVITHGAQFEVGTIFYISGVKLPDNMKFGIDATYMAISGYVNLDKSQNENKTDSYFRAGMKVGPCFSYNFAGNWIGDVYVKAYPHTFVTGEKENSHLDAKTQTKVGLSTGLNIRYKALVIGYEFMTGKYKFDFVDPSMDVTSDSKNIAIPTSVLSIGVKF